MKKYVIRGGRPLYGKVNISGAKNAAVAIIPAALLVDGICRIENIPQISDVGLLLSMLNVMPNTPPENVKAAIEQMMQYSGR